MKTTLPVILLLALASMISFAQEIEVQPGTVVVKFRAAETAFAPHNGGGELRAALELIGAGNFRPLLQQNPAFNMGRQAASAEACLRDEELSKIKIVEFGSPITPWEAAAALAGVPEVEYAEPYFLFHAAGTAYTPNDSMFAQLEYMKLVQAEDAWELSRGDTSVVIAVADTEIKWDHPDLEPNIWTNPGETGLDGQNRDKRSNGVDDDGNGMIDDWHGWDYAGKNNSTPDNDTRDSTGSHGTSVTGLAGAATDNLIGISSIAHTCRILPIKIGPDGGGSLAFGYDAIDYASRMGARVFNASWGSHGYSRALEEVVNAAVARGMVIVGGAGNHGGTAPFYPASYPAVLDAGVCNADDVIAGASGFGPTLDVLSPAEGAFSTNVRNGYSRWGAVTSAAAPMASSLCALAVAHFPSYTAEQIRERVRVTCDDIDSKNPSRAGLAGKGRINALRALADPPTPSLRIASFEIKDPNSDKRLDVGEAVGIAVTLKNYLAATGAPVELTLVPVQNAGNVQVTKGSATFPAIPGGGTADNSTDPFVFTVNASQNYDAIVLFRVDFVAGEYRDFDFVTASVNPSYSDMQSGQLSMTVQANATYGFKDYPNNTQGNGMRFAGQNVQLYLGAVLMATDEAHVVGNARSSGNFLARDNDLRMLEAVVISRPSGAAAGKAVSRFTDSGADSARRLNVRVRHEVVDYSNHGLTDLLLSVFTIENRGMELLSGLRFGLFMDFGGYPEYYIANVGYDSTRRFAYITKAGFTTVGTFVFDTLSQSDERRANFWAINNDQRVAGNPFGTLDGFTAKEKWRALSTYAGNRGATAGNLAYVITAPAQDIPAGESRTVAFGLLAGSALSALRSKVDTARAMLLNPPVVGIAAYPFLPELPLITGVYPHPVCDAAGVEFELPQACFARLELINALGSRIALLKEGVYPAGRHSETFRAASLTAGAYMLRLSTGAASVQKIFLIVK